MPRGETRARPRTKEVVLALLLALGALAAAGIARASVRPAQPVVADAAAAAAAAEDRARLVRERNAAVLSPPSVLEEWQYLCWDAPEPSSPTITLATVAPGLPEKYRAFMRANRLAYAARQGYRYCELATLDIHRIAAWSKLPWVLALLPCADAVVHLDADAMIVNMSLPLKPWVDYMAAEGLELLLSSDVIPESPMNFGGFIARPAPWVWTFFRELYNRCACAWGRTHDWPAEQGIVYDLLAGGAARTREARTRARIVDHFGWNTVTPVGGGHQYGVRPREVVAHVPHAGARPGSKCEGAEGPATPECKYDGVLLYYETVSGMHGLPTVEELVAAPFPPGVPGACQAVRSELLVAAGETYHERGDGHASSALLLEAGRGGRVGGVTVGEIACIGGREMKCDLPALWNYTSGTGPLMTHPRAVEHRR